MGHSSREYSPGYTGGSPSGARNQRGAHVSRRRSRSCGARARGWVPSLRAYVRCARYAPSLSLRTSPACASAKAAQLASPPQTRNLQPGLALSHGAAGTWAALHGQAGEAVSTGSGPSRGLAEQGLPEERSEGASARKPSRAGAGRGAAPGAAARRTRRSARCVSSSAYFSAPAARWSPSCAGVARVSN